MEVLENNKTVLVKGNVIGFEESTLEPLKYLVQFPDLTTASLSVDMIEDEPQAGHADEAPRYVKNILARLRELPLHDKGCNDYLLPSVLHYPIIEHLPLQLAYVHQRRSRCW